MPRRTNSEQLESLQNAIEHNPGQGLSFFARLLGWPHEKVSRRLVSLNDHGVLLSEDERGGLWPFRKTGRRE